MTCYGFVVVLYFPAAYNDIAPPSLSERKMTMEEMQTPVVQVPETPTPPPVPSKKKKKNRKKLVSRIIGLAVAVAVIGGVAFGMYRFMNPKEEKTILTDFVTLGTIQSTVEGRGSLSAKNSASLTLTTGGTVQEVFISEGQQVMEGDPLYTIDSSEAQAEVQKAQETLAGYEKQLQNIYDSYADLVVTAPFDGKLIDAETLNDGSTLGSGTKIATLVDDSKMKLSLYVNYTYQNDIAAGQAVTVSVPSSMTSIPNAVVEEVRMVSYITPEGAKCFEVVLSMDNPGTLTAGMGATAVFQTAGGEAIYPYAPGTLAYTRSTDLVTKVSGEIVSSNLINYGYVAAGETLLTLSAEDNDDQITSLQEQIRTAQEALQKAQDNLANFNAVAPISGTVLLCSLTPGQEVASGTTVVQIADTSTLTATIQIDERNYSYVRAGMEIQLMDYNDNMIPGIIQSVSMTPSSNESSATVYYPAVVEVDNSMGLLSSGMSIQYSMVTNEIRDCLVVPVQSVQYISDADGNPQTVAFLKVDSRPENAVDMPAEAAENVPTEADGFYAVPVEVGASSDTQVQILSGLNEGDEIFTGFLTDSYNSYGY